MLEYDSKSSELATFNATEESSYTTSVYQKDNSNYIALYTELLKNIVSKSYEKNDIATVIPQVDNNNHTNTIIESNKKILGKKNDIPKYPFPIKKDFTSSFYIEPQEYNGRVLSIEGDKFIAELVNIVDNTDTLRAEFNNSDIDKGDMYLLKEGALFIWIIGKEECNGTQKKISQLIFRRASSWTKRDIERIEKNAKNRAFAIRALFTEDTSTT
jgi:hypothetical protein